MNKNTFILVFAALVSAASSLPALTVPYTEDFPSGHANWQNNANGLAAFQATGGPDGSSYISVPFSFQDQAAGATPVVFRAHTSTPFGPASGGNLFGDWITGGVGTFSTYVRHNAPEPINFFLRTATPIGFPGFIVLHDDFVAPNTWTLLEFEIDPANPNNTPEGPMSSFSGVMGNVGRVHVGLFVPGSLAGSAQNFTFDLDQVAVGVPEPTSFVLGSMAVVLGLACRRSR